MCQNSAQPCIPLLYQLVSFLKSEKSCEPDFNLCNGPMPCLAETNSCPLKGCLLYKLLCKNYSNSHCYSQINTCTNKCNLNGCNSSSDKVDRAIELILCDIFKYCNSCLKNCTCNEYAESKDCILNTKKCCKPTTSCITGDIKCPFLSMLSQCCNNQTKCRTHCDFPFSRCNTSQTSFKCPYSFCCLNMCSNSNCKLTEDCKPCGQELNAKNEKCNFRSYDNCCKKSCYDQSLIPAINALCVLCNSIKESKAMDMWFEKCQSKNNSCNLFNALLGIGRNNNTQCDEHICTINKDQCKCNCSSIDMQNSNYCLLSKLKSCPFLKKMFNCCLVKSCIINKLCKCNDKNCWLKNICESISNEYSSANENCYSNLFNCLCNNQYSSKAKRCLCKNEINGEEAMQTIDNDDKYKELLCQLAQIPTIQNFDIYETIRKIENNREDTDSNNLKCKVAKCDECLPHAVPNNLNVFGKGVCNCSSDCLCKKYLYLCTCITYPQTNTYQNCSCIGEICKNDDCCNKKLKNKNKNIKDKKNVNCQCINGGRNLKESTFDISYSKCNNCVQANHGTSNDETEINNNIGDNNKNKNTTSKNTNRANNNHNSSMTKNDTSNMHTCPDNDCVGNKNSCNADNKAKKPQTSKSTITYEAMPYNDEIDITNIYEEYIKPIKIDGLTFSQICEIVPGPFGLNKLIFTCVVNNEDLATDTIEEELETVNMSQSDRERYIELRRVGKLEDYDDMWENKLIGTVKIISFQKL